MTQEAMRPRPDNSTHVQLEVRVTGETGAGGNHTLLDELQRCMTRRCCLQASQNGLLHWSMVGRGLALAMRQFLRMIDDDTLVAQMYWVTLQSGIRRSPHSPRSWRVASANKAQPCM